MFTLNEISILNILLNKYGRFLRDIGVSPPPIHSHCRVKVYNHLIKGDNIDFSFEELEYLYDVVETELYNEGEHVGNKDNSALHSILFKIGCMERID